MWIDWRKYKELLRKDELTDDEWELFKAFYRMEEEATSQRYDRKGNEERGED